MKARATNRPVRQPRWANWPDERLLDLRFDQLGVRLNDVPALRGMIDQLFAELAAAGLRRFRPGAWLSDEWFTPDKTAGFAIPFYLAHPRLTRLERAQMLEVEGGTRDWAMRILRHEAGHAIDNAYRLHLRQRYRALFGSFFEPYPDSYRPKPYSKKFVVHLDMWYAQAHPAEDFAETFAVWLNPGSNWREQYADWPALRKLRFIDATMSEIADRPPLVRVRAREKPLEHMGRTLREHYERKRNRYLRKHPRFYDRDLLRIFSGAPEYARRGAAAPFLRGVREELRLMISRWTGESQLTIDAALADMIRRVDEMGLRLRKPAAETKVDLMMMLAVQTMNYLNDGRHRVIV